MTVSVMLRCSRQAVSSSDLDLPQSFCKFEEGEATLVLSQPSQSGMGVKKSNRGIRHDLREAKRSFRC